MLVPRTGALQVANESLLPLRDVKRHLRVLGERFVGMREIPTDAIVGSVDRSVDFDRFFRTRRRDLKKRIDGLREAFRDRPMPPITVYEAGGLYFVVDGHHRVALARQQGAPLMDAEVTQIETSHRLHPDVDILELIHTEQHRRFKDRTGLHDVAPDAVVEFSRPLGYGELLQVIEAHAYGLSQQRGSLVHMAEATRDWYDTSWLPALEAIESSGLRTGIRLQDRWGPIPVDLPQAPGAAGCRAGATWETAAAVLARLPVARGHRRETLAARRRPFRRAEVTNPAETSGAGVLEGVHANGSSAAPAPRAASRRTRPAPRSGRTRRP